MPLNTSSNREQSPRTRRPALLVGHAVMVARLVLLSRREVGCAQGFEPHDGLRSYNVGTSFKRSSFFKRSIVQTRRLAGRDG